MEEMVYFLTSYEFENLHRASLGSNWIIPDEQHVRIILKRVSNVLLAFFKDLIETWRKQNNPLRSHERPLRFLQRPDRDMDENNMSELSSKKSGTSS